MPVGCVIAFGQGRNVSDDDACAASLCDGVHLAFNADVAFTLQRLAPTDYRRAPLQPH